MGVGDDQERSVGPPPRPAPIKRRPEQPARSSTANEALGFRNRVIAGVVFAFLYILTFGVLRGQMVPGVIAGVLGGILVFLLLRRADERRRNRQS